MIQLFGIHDQINGGGYSRGYFYIIFKKHYVFVDQFDTEILPLSRPDFPKDLIRKELVLSE
jgi:hypothetical protein